MMNQYDKKHYEYSRTSQDAFGYRLKRNEFDEPKENYLGYILFVLILVTVISYYAS